MSPEYNPRPQPSSRDRAAKYIITNCTARCTVNPRNLPGEMGELIHSWYEQGDSNQIIMQKLKTIGGPKLSNGGLGRHRQHHLTRADQLVDPTLAPEPEAKTDLEVLETIIRRGAQQMDIAGTKITAEQTLRAIELKNRLTEGSIFEKFFEVLDAEGEEAFAEEAPEAIASADEAAQALPEE